MMVAKAHNVNVAGFMIYRKLPRFINKKELTKLIERSNSTSVAKIPTLTKSLI